MRLIAGMLLLGALVVACSEEDDPFHPEERAAITVQNRSGRTINAVFFRECNVVPWGTDRADPVARLRRIHRAAEKVKRTARREEAQLLAQAGEAFAPGFLSFVMRNFGIAPSPSARGGRTRART